MKIRISLFTWLLWIVSYLNNSSKAMFFLFMMMFIHELSHCLMALFFKLEISEIIIYPFGFCANIPTLKHESCLIQICVLLMGPIWHLICPFFLTFLLHKNYVSLAFYQWLLMMNWQELLFNCMPIGPLDGSGILFALLNCFFPYRKSLILSSVISICFAFFLFINIIPLSASSLFVLITLVTINVMSLIQVNENFRQAVFRRKKDTSKLPVCFHQKDDFYLYRHNIYMCGSQLFDENDFLYEILLKNKSRNRLCGIISKGSE